VIGWRNVLCVLSGAGQWTVGGSQGLRVKALVGVAVLLLVSTVLVFDPTRASAQKVANPGNVTFTVQTGDITVGDNTFTFDQNRDPQCSDGSNNDGDQDSAVDYPADPQCSSATDDSEVAGGFQPMSPVTLSGTIDGAGAVNIPTSGIVFPPQYIWADGVVTVRIQALAAISGTLNPLTGAANLPAQLRVKLEGSPSGVSLGDSCYITPININPFTTGTNGAVTGVPYNASTGNVTVANGTFSVPGASGCGFLGVANGPINDALGLPSPSGNNTAVLGLHSSPIIAPAITANFTASPGTTGQAPFTVTFNAAGSTATAGIANYQFDFTNNGSFDAVRTPPTTTASFTYTAAGSYTAKLRVTDNQGDFVEKTLPITVAVNQPPVANAQDVTTNEDTAVDITLSGSDPAGDPLTFSVVSGSGPTNGDLTGTPPNITYTPDENFNGTDSFQYRAQDPAGNTSAPATVTIHVTPANDQPTISGDSVSTAEDTPVGVAVTADDVDGDTLVYATSNGPVHGSLSGSGPTYTYTPDADYNGPDGFDVTVYDGHGGSATASVDITVTAVNDRPVANDQIVSTTQDTPVSFTLDVHDVDGPTISYTITGPPQHGTLSGSAPDLTYTPDAGYFGQDFVSYAVSDGAGGSDTATVTINVVQPGNDPPIANDQTVTTDEDEATSFTLDASDPNGDPLTVTVTSGPDHGTLSGTGLNRSYTPAANFNGTDAFIYNVDDGRGGVVSATATIEVAPINDAPTASAQAATTDEDTSVVITLNTTDVDGEALTYTIDGPSHGTLSGTAPNLLYSPAPNFHGLDSFTYEACDAAEACVSSGVSITVTSVPDDPVAANQVVGTNEDTRVDFTLAATDGDGDELTIAIGDQPDHGSLSGTGLDRRYTPAANFNGLDSFTYQACDPGGACDSATVTINVTPVNDPPTAQGQSVLTNEDTAVAVTLVAGDVDGDALAYAITSSPAHGQLTGTAPNLTFAPNANFHGNDAFTYSVDDGNGGTASATVTVGVISVQDTPDAQAQSITTPEDTAVPITLVATDGDGDALQYFVEHGPTHGSLTGGDSFEFSARDPSGRSDRATVSITVTPFDNVPTTLVAQPATVGRIPPRIVKPLEARLTQSDTNAPLAGKTIDFYVASTRRCSVATDANGVARCSPPATSVQTATSYEARFAGDEDYAPSSATAPINKTT
jgi:Big-like domain-containing protein/PKD domain-containing protein